MGANAEQGPRELLEALQESHEHPQLSGELSPDQIELVFARVGVPEEQRAEHAARVAGMRSGFARSLLVDLLEHMKEEDARDLRDTLLDEDFLLVSELRSRDVNAHALQAENGGWLVVLNEGLMAFVYKAARVLGRHVQDSDGSDGADIAESARLLAVQLSWQAEAGIPTGPDFDVAVSGLRYANSLAVGAERFAVAHELSHHLLGHLEHGTRDMLVNNQAVSAAAIDPDDELEADNLALRLTLESLSGQDQSRFSLTYAGIDLLFWLIDLLEEIGAAPEASTHPPAAERMRALRAALQTKSSEDKVKAIAGLADKLAPLYEQLRPVVLEEIDGELGQRRKRQFSEELDALLANATPGPRATIPVPDYASFRAGFLSQLYDAPASALADLMAERIMRAVEGAQDGRSEDYAQFKLLANACSYAPDAAFLIDQRLPSPILEHFLSKQLAAE